MTSDSAPPVALLRGSGRVRGHVTGATGRPISGAHVTVWGTGIEMVTHEDGAFTLGNLPGGTHTLEARAVGFAPARQPMDIVAGSQGADGGRAYEPRDHTRHDQGEGAAGSTRRAV